MAEKAGPGRRNRGRRRNALAGQAFAEAVPTMMLIRILRAQAEGDDEALGDGETMVDTIPLSALPKLRKVRLCDTVHNSKVVQTLVDAGFRASRQDGIVTLER